MRVTFALPVPLLSLEITADVEPESGPGLAGKVQVDIESATAMWDGEPVDAAKKRYRWQVFDGDLDAINRWLQEALRQKIQEEAIKCSNS